eukprot:scaffold23014_cov71-Cyclotella_meneghiniana.AAC.4
MSLARKSSSTDEFYDAVESMDEIPSSSREDSHVNNVESNLISNSHSVEENTENDAAIFADNHNINGSSENANETSSTNQLLESEENWVSARCLFDSNMAGHGHDRKNSEETNNRASSRCVLDNLNAPSLMDAVSSSISHEEVDRGERNDAIHIESIRSAGFEVGEKKPCAEKQSNESGYDELEAETSEPVNDEEQTNSIETAPQQSEVQTQQISDSKVHDENHDVSVGECCTTIEHISLNQQQHNIDSTLVESSDIYSENDSMQHVNEIDHIQPSVSDSKIADKSFILNTEAIQSSKEESSCFDRESDNGFLPVDSDSITTANTKLLNPTQQTDQDTNDKKKDSSHYSTPLQHSTKKITDDCSVLDYCDLTSPLEALYLMCSNAKRGGNLLKRESMEELLNDVDDTTAPERTTSSYDVDPAGAAPLSPPDNYNLAEESDSDDDSSSSSPSKFRIVDKDTGGIFDMRRVMKDIDEAGETAAFDTKYSFLPSKRDLKLSRSVINGSQDQPCMNSRDEVSSVPLASCSFDTQGSVSFRDFPDIPSSSSMDSSTKKKTKFSSLKRSVANKLHKPSFNRSRTTSADTMPGNAIYVKSSTRHNLTRASSSDLPNSQHSSSFNPMLLVKTTLKCHEGPAWCAAFSLDGRFLATGGEDGNVCIWVVAPKSAVLHPDGASLLKKDNNKFDSPKEEDVEDVDQTNNHSPLTMDSEERDEEKVGISKTSSNESAPPLNFIGTGPELATNLEIISSTPLQRFQDHSADVIDLSWSHTNFLLTASLDSSVRLYHHSKSHCLHLFKHADLVASVAFHPTDERYFISGGIDKKLRLWSIPDGRVKDWAQAPDVITALRFTPDGKYAVAG